MLLRSVKLEVLSEALQDQEQMLEDVHVGNWQAVTGICKKLVTGVAAGHHSAVLPLALPPLMGRECQGRNHY